MRNDSRLSRMLHVLLHMARNDAPMTSGTIAQMLGTNPVVVRRTMAGLRDAGYVRSEKGHGGGWVIAADLAQVSLLDVHNAVGGPRIFAIGNEHANPECAVEQAVNSAIADALRDAEQLLIARLGAVSLARLARDFDAQCKLS
jgi:DNA-binding IscR family transcriptional regulator